jgi:hypothetical protein
VREPVRQGGGQTFFAGDLRPVGKAQICGDYAEFAKNGKSGVGPVRTCGTSGWAGMPIIPCLRDAADDKRGQKDPCQKARQASLKKVGHACCTRSALTSALLLSHHQVSAPSRTAVESGWARSVVTYQVWALSTCQGVAYANQSPVSCSVT